MITRRALLRTGLLAGAPLAFGGYAVAVEPMLAPAVTRYRLTPPGWPERLALRVAVIADIHACEPWMPAERVHAIALAANALEPDLIVLLGDFNAGHRFVTGPVLPEEWGEALAVLRAPLGTFAVLGNHDWWHGPLPETPGGPEPVRRALAGRGIRVLENAALPLAKDGRRFWLAGLADQMAHILRDCMPCGADDLSGTLAQVRDEAPVLMLMHEPFLFPMMPARVSLTLCGHTHGGQVKLPLLGTPFTPTRTYLYGHFVEGGRHLIVSGGLGESGFPARFQVPPEIVLVELGGEPAPSASARPALATPRALL